MKRWIAGAVILIWIFWVMWNQGGAGFALGYLGIFLAVLGIVGGILWWRRRPARRKQNDFSQQ